MILRICLALGLITAPAWGVLCFPFYVTVSGLPDPKFETLTINSQQALPGEHQPWFVPGRAPRIRLTKESFESILSTVICCGLSREEMSPILSSFVGPDGNGEAPVAILYEKAFQLSLEKARVSDPMCYDCMSTALTYLDGKYFARVDDADVPNYGDEFFGRLYKREKDKKLKWGDMVTVERNDKRAHVMIYLSHGLVLHKLGRTDVTIEPTLQGRDFYQKYYDEHRPRETNRMSLTPWHRQPSEKP